MTDCECFKLSKAQSFILMAVFLLGAIEILGHGSARDVVFHRHKFGNESTNMKLICFYVFTSEFDPNILGDLCTHINLGFFKISESNHTIEPTAGQLEVLKKAVALKEKWKDLKIVISVGGAGNKSYSAMVQNHETRKVFIKSVMKLLKEFKIDGLDLDWEWPVVVSGNEKERVKFIQLLYEIREQFDRQDKHYILSADVSSARIISELSYIIRYITMYVDYVNIMCYDYHYFSKWFPFTGHNAPLYGADEMPFVVDTFNVNNSIHYWISNMMPREKIVVGLATFGHSFRLLLSGKHSLLAPAVGFGSIGQGGFVDYRDICQFLKERDTTVVYDNVAKVPYAYRYSDWISFDNEASLTLKASYVLEQKLGGAMIFSANADDFRGTCGGNGLPLPLIRTVRSILFNEV